jgi:DnaJ-class molecular chaperone
MSEDYYDILGIGKDADPQSIRKAYRREGGDLVRDFPFASIVATEPLLEVLLSAEEAARGVSVPVVVPISLPCPECGAGGFWQRMLCFTCGGTGSIRTTKRMILNMPPGVLSGREFLIAAGDLPSGSLRVRVLVG